MVSHGFLAEVQRNMEDQMREDFYSQNPDLLDAIFEIDGRKLYAHRLRLSVASPTFKAMLSDRWSSKNDTIKINGYGYDDFKEFVTFIYSGYCNLNDANIFTMMDMAEFYQVNHLKVLCDQYLSNIKLTNENIFQLMEFSNKYSLVQTKQSILVFVAENFTKIVESEAFFKANKSLIKEFMPFASKSYVKPEKLFEAAFYWAEHQAKQKQSTEDNLNEMIKTEITPLLPYIRFKKMQLKFLNTFVAERGFILSNDELSDILKNADPEPDVEISFLLKQSIYDQSYSKDNPPRRARPAYMLWMHENRARLTQPGMGVTDVTHAAGIEWGQLQDKSIWQKLADDDRKRYEREMIEYKNAMESRILHIFL